MPADALWHGSMDAAQTYNDILVPVIFTPWARELTARADLDAARSILDVACGTGAVTRMAATKAGGDARVVGSDLSPWMLRAAATAAEREGLKIEWVEADGCALPFGEGEFDVLFCQMGLQFFPDRAGAVRGFRRVLRPGGRAVVSCATALEENPQVATQVAAFGKHLGPEFADGIRGVCGLSDAGEMRGLFEDAGFSEVTLEHVTVPMHHPDARAFFAGAIGATPVGNVLAGLSPERQEALMEDILDGMSDYRDGAGLSFPQVGHVVTAVR